MHVVTNQPLAVKEKYSSGLVDHGAHLKKDQKHSHYLTEGNAIGFAFDSIGGISEFAMEFINHLYARGRGNRKRNWDSESLRVALRKEFLDPLSMVLCSIVSSTTNSLAFQTREQMGPSLLTPPPALALWRFTVSRPVGPG